MALTRRMRKKIMKKRGIGYVSVFFLATIASWILGKVTGLDWNFRDFILDFYVYILLGCIVFDAVTSAIRKYKNKDSEEDVAETKKPAKTQKKKSSVK